MADGPQFDFLADSWGIGLSVGAKTEIAENAESLSRRHIEEYIKDTDIRKFGVISSLPKEVSRHVGPLPPGKYFVQVQKSVNITQPSKFQEEFDGGKWRLLALEMSDGEQKLKGIEYAHTNCISVDTWPGTKLLLVSSAKSPLSVSNGHILLTDGTVQLIGGQVPKLVESWKQSKEVQENRLLWKSEGVKKKEDGEGAPLWVDFDPRKAPRSGHRSAEEERKEWQKTMIGPSSGTKADDEKQRDGPRFQAEDFAEDGVAPKVVSSQVSANAFKKDEGRKGKGKGKGESGSRSEGGRRGRGDDDYEPEKRAPVANASLAAFIKPTKKGELPDEALNLLAADSTEATGASAWDGGDWEESSWDASGWGQGWSGGYSGGGGGGYGGGGGQRKGGGKGRGKGGKGKGGGGKRSGGGW